MQQKRDNLKLNETQIWLSVQNADYYKAEDLNNIVQQRAEKELTFKERISAFDDIQTLEEALSLAEKILPISQEISRFNIGNAKCVVVKRNNLFRLTFDSDTEFISYNFE